MARPRQGQGEQCPQHRHGEHREYRIIREHPLSAPQRAELIDFHRPEFSVDVENSYPMTKTPNKAANQNPNSSKNRVSTTLNHPKTKIPFSLLQLPLTLIHRPPPPTIL